MARTPTRTRTASDANPTTPSLYFSGMRARYSKISALMAGTAGVRKAVWLPQHVAESNEAFDKRVMRSTLFNFYRDTVSHLVGQVFAKPVTFENAPGEGSEEADWILDADREGNSLSTLARRYFSQAVQKAEAYLFIDYPEEDPEVSTLADQRLKGRRPYAFIVRAEQVLQITTSRIRGRQVVKRFRYERTIIESRGDFGEQAVLEVLDYRADLGRVHRFRQIGNTGNRWSLVSDLPYDFKQEGESLVSVVPLRLVEEDEDGLRRPPLDDLADKNLEHFQSASDQRNILTFGRFPMLYGSGITGDDMPKDEHGKFKLAPNSVLLTADPQGKWGYVEPEGKAIEAGERDLERLVEEMAHLAMQPLVKAGGNETATQNVLEESKAKASLESWGVLLQDALDQALLFMGLWVDRDFKPGATVNTTFGLRKADQSQLTVLDAARARGDISRSQYLKQLIALGLLPDTFDLVANDAELENEMPEGMLPLVPGSMPAPLVPDNDPDDDE